jgi:cysteine-rich repeat protein
MGRIRAGLMDVRLIPVLMAGAVVAGCPKTETGGVDANDAGSGIDAEVEGGADATEPVCGNGVVEEGEVCDDGNTTSEGEGGCLADCSAVQECGDGIVNGTEQCDYTTDCSEFYPDEAVGVGTLCCDPETCLFDTWMHGADAGTDPPDCYSPYQNLHIAYRDGSVGCSCIKENYDTCMEPDATGGGSHVALWCTGGRWLAVEDGACFIKDFCYMPNVNLERIELEGSVGCTCNEEGMVVCEWYEIPYDPGRQYVGLECRNGSWEAFVGAPCP